MIRVRTVLTCITAIAILGAGPASVSGAEVPWTLSYDALTSLVTFTTDNTTQQIVLPTTRLAETYVRVTATGDDSQDIFRISGRALAGGVILSGQMAEIRAGRPASGANPEFRIEIISLTTAYVEPITWGQLKNMFNKK
jgi:hypothetical protein